MMTEVTLAIVLLFGVRPTDPATFVVIVLLLTMVALLACYLLISTNAQRLDRTRPLIIEAVDAEARGIASALTPRPAEMPQHCAKEPRRLNRRPRTTFGAAGLT